MMAENVTVHFKSVMLADRWKCLLVGVLFYVIADAGLFSSFDAWIYIALVAIFLPRFSVCLLILVGATQDARGLANQWWYPAFATAGLSILAYYLLKQRITWAKDQTDGRLVRCALFAVSVMFYGFILSVMQNYLGGYAQSSERPPLLIAGLASFMIITALISLRLVFENDELRRGLGYVVILAILNNVVVLLIQGVAGNTLFHSPDGVQNMLQATQLTEQTALGIPRLTGTYLTPNGFGLYTALLVLVWIYLRFDAKRPGAITVWTVVAVGLLFSLGTMSKDVTLFFGGLTFLLIVWRYGWLRASAAVVAFVVIAAILIDIHYGSDWNNLAIAFRIHSAAIAQDSYRLQAWKYVVSNFTAVDWLIGTGLASWPAIFQTALGFKLADPHTWVLSVPGSFGLFGLLFYAYLFVQLILAAYSANARIRFLALTLLYLVFLIDLFEIMLPLGNTPVTYVIWLLIGLCLNNVTAIPRYAIPIAAEPHVESGRK